MNSRGDTILYLSRRDVARALGGVDVVETISSALSAHGRGETVLPAEAYLAWDHADERLRSLSMPGLVDRCPGVKLINANPANPGRGLPRASGLIVLFDIETARPTCILEGGRISCLRTAAVTAVAAGILGTQPIERLALLGAGALAECHLQLLPARLPALHWIRLYDLDPARAAKLAAAAADARIVVCDSAERAIRGAELVVPVTTTTSGYIRYEWLQPGALLVNVSLDDPLPEVVLRAAKIFVDDWTLVAQDERRLLGRMLRAGQISGPAEAADGVPAIDGELGQLLTGACEGRSSPDEIILVNPFGLAIEDLALARRVQQHALELGLGTALER
ncbi:MAG: ornithine cyclodeaminase [Actinomycetota bacterium]|nr:ornithine cyclodeaminase [Actinomycetota bacterium]